MASPSLLILSRNPKLYSTRRLVAAARARQLAPRVLDTLLCDLLLEADPPRLFYRGDEVEPGTVRVVIPRIGASITGYGLAVVNQFDLMGVPVLNGAAAIGRSRDKLRACSCWPAPASTSPGRCSAATAATSSSGRAGGRAARHHQAGPRRPGRGGDDRLHDAGGDRPSSTRSGSSARRSSSQEFVNESRGRDVRALVVGDKVVAAMRRTARAGEFRSNIHRGGAATRLELPGDYAGAAVQAARVVGLEIAGVDLLEARTGPMIMEVNSSRASRPWSGRPGPTSRPDYVEHAVAFAARASRTPAARTSSR